MSPRRDVLPMQHKSVQSPIWQELLVGVELVFLRISPVYWGHGIPHGDGSAVVLVPGFLGTDFYLSHFRTWLGRIGYKPYYSGIRMNAECPNLFEVSCKVRFANGPGTARIDQCSCGWRLIPLRRVGFPLDRLLT